MLEKLKDRLCDNAEHWYRMWSSWMAVAWGLIVTAFWNDPSIIASLASEMPSEVRAMLSPVVLGIAAGLPIIVRLAKQNKLPPPTQKPSDG